MNTILNPSEGHFAMLSIVQLDERKLSSDVLDRILDTEIFTDETVNGQHLNRKIYSVEWLKNLLENPEDDTNDSVKDELIEIYSRIKDANFFLVTSKI